jgi:DNA repair exonuclease SbcCD ATPase subunit
MPTRPTKRPGTSTSSSGRYRQVPRMTCGGSLRIKQNHLEWSFNEDKGVIVHLDAEDEDIDKGRDCECDVCSRYLMHHSLENGKGKSLDEARVARDRWFRQNLDPFKDSVEQQELVAKTQELERVRGELTGKCCEAERLRTNLKVAEDTLENERQQRIAISRVHSQLQRQCQEEDRERTRLHKALKEQKERGEVSRQRLDELQAERVRRRLNFSNLRRELETTRRELETTRCELETTRRELETTRRELETARREIVQMRLPPPGFVEDASTSSAVPTGLSQNEAIPVSP